MNFLKNIGALELIVIGVVAVSLFGTKKMKDVAKGLGKSTKEFKKAKEEYDKTVAEDDAPEKEAEKEEEVKA